MASRSEAQRRRDDRRRQRRRYRRRRAVVALLAVIVGGLVTYALFPRAPALTPLQRRIVTIATSQLGYESDPPNSYCNRFSAYWQAGLTDCGPGLRDEEWCADFAAWVWRRAGVRFAYGSAPGELNSASVSFYAWGVAHGTWHAPGSGYVPHPGDVAIYGLDLETMTAQHVAIVTSDDADARGPNVINGDGSRTAFSIVEVGNDQWKADITGSGAVLAGYVAPVRAKPTTS